MVVEKSLVYINFILFVFFANIYYLIGLYNNERNSYVFYYGLSARTAVGGPQSNKNDIAIIIGIIQMYLTIYINIIELSGKSDGFILKSLKKLIVK